MLAISARTRAQTVTNTAATLGVPLPADYLEQVDEAEAFTEAAKQTVCTPEKLHAAVLDAIQEGRDYWSDPKIQRFALDTQLTSSNIFAAARSRSENLILAALRDHADDILDGWSDALDEHSAHLVTAAEAGLNLSSAAAAVARGGDIMHHLHNAQIAVKAWAAAEHGFHALAAVAGVSINVTGPVALTPARLAELAPAYEMARDERSREVGAWVLARCGIALQLATEPCPVALTFRAWSAGGCCRRIGRARPRIGAAADPALTAGRRTTGGTERGSDTGRRSAVATSAARGTRALRRTTRANTASAPEPPCGRSTAERRGKRTRRGRFHSPRSPRRPMSRGMSR